MTPRKIPVLAACALALLAACGSAQPPAATVNGAPISDARLSTDVALFTTITTLAKQSCGTPAAGESASAACARSVLGVLIQQSLVAGYAKEHGISAASSDVSTEADGLVAQLGGAQAWDAALRKGGVTNADFRDLVRRIALYGAVQKAVVAERVTTAVLRKQYRDGIQQFTTLHAEHILVKTKAEAVQVESELGGPGASEQRFLDLAKRVSIDPSAAQNSGDLGDQPVSALDPTFVQAALALEAGQISQPVHTQDGWHVIRLVSTGVQPFESVRDQLSQQLSQQAFSTWMQEQLTSADVTVNPRYGRWDASVLGIVPVNSTATGTPPPAPVGSVSP